MFGVYHNYMTLLLCLFFQFSLPSTDVWNRKPILLYFINYHYPYLNVLSSSSPFCTMPLACGALPFSTSFFVGSNGDGALSFLSLPLSPPPFCKQKRKNQPSVFHYRAYTDIVIKLTNSQPNIPTARITVKASYLLLSQCLTPSSNNVVYQINQLKHGCPLLSKLRY